MFKLSNAEINKVAHTSYSDEFLDMMRKWYDPDLHKGKDLEQLLLHNVRPDNLHGVMYQHILNHTKVEGRSVLEVGCGSGQNVESWYRAGAAKITTLDIDEFPVEITKQRCKDLGIDNTTIIHADFISHEFDEQFDIVNCVQVIEHVGKENQVEALIKLLDLTKINGVIFIQIPNRSCIIDAHDSRLPFAHWLPRKISAPYARLFGRTPPVWEPMAYGRVKRILEENGGEILSKVDLCRTVNEFIDYRVNKRRSFKNIVFAGVVLFLYPFLRGNINSILPNINIFVRKVR